MKKKFSKIQIAGFVLLAGGLSVSLAQAEGVNLLGTKEIVVKRSITKEASQCIECHAKKTPGIVEGW